MPPSSPSSDLASALAEVGCAERRGFVSEARATANDPLTHLSIGMAAGVAAVLLVHRVNARQQMKGAECWLASSMIR